MSKIELYVINPQSASSVRIDLSNEPTITLDIEGQPLNIRVTRKEVEKLIADIVYIGGDVLSYDDTSLEAWVT